MASVDMQKMTYAEMRGKKVHFDDQMRETHEHSNKDIQRDKTKDNCWIGCKDFEDACNKVQARTAEVDLLHPPKKIRKDRVTVIALDIKCPQEIADYGKEDEYFSRVYDTLVDMYGRENVHGLTIHKDEVHAYTDYTGGTPEERISLIHGHGWISPYARWTEKGVEREGINGKHFLRKATYTDLNKAVDAMCRKEFGVAYLTGGIAGKKSVETLKKETETLSQIHTQIQTESSILTDITTQKEEAQQDLKRMKELPGNLVMVKKGRIEQLEETEKRYQEEKPLIDQARKDIKKASDSMDTVRKKEENLKKEKRLFDQKVNEAANRKVSLLRDAAINFIKEMGLYDQFTKWAEKISNKIKQKL